VITTVSLKRSFLLIQEPAIVPNCINLVLSRSIESFGRSTAEPVSRASQPSHSTAEPLVLCNLGYTLASMMGCNDPYYLTIKLAIAAL
jgi:hypothetical protein